MKMLFDLPSYRTIMNQLKSDDLEETEKVNQKSIILGLFGVPNANSGLLFGMEVIMLSKPTKYGYKAYVTYGFIQNIVIGKRSRRVEWNTKLNKYYLGANAIGNYLDYREYRKIQAFARCIKRRLLSDLTENMSNVTLDMTSDVDNYLLYTDRMKEKL